MKLLNSFIICLTFFLSNAQAQLISIPIPGSTLSLTVQANPQPLQDIKNNTAATAHNLGDDGWANVALPFKFPFYGKTFDTSTMYSNGAVQFGNSIPAGGWPQSNNSFCCHGMILTTTGISVGYNYSIMPLWTDLTGYSNNHYTLGTNNSMTYGWYDVSQFGTNNKSSFELKIDNNGGIDMRWSGALVTNAPVTIGTIGDASKGEFTQNYFSQAGINITGLTQLATGQDLCVSNPLSSPACLGYQAAYTQQQCLVNALFDPTCPGYQQAYLNAQCIIDSLYSRLCSGYATAYAIKYLIPMDSTTALAINSSLSATASVKASDPVSVNTNGTVTTTPSATGNSTVDAIISTPNATSPASVTSVVNTPPPPGAAQSPTSTATTQASAPPLPPPAAVQQERAADNKKTEGAVASVEKKAGGNAEAAKKEATAQAKELANNISKAATLEAQAANQGLVVGLIAYVPGFSAYQNARIPDALGATVAKQYHKPVIDNRAAQRRLSGANEYKWQQMVDSQYQTKD